MSDHHHSHGDHGHDHDHEVPETAVDAGSQALAEALHSSFTIVKIVMGLMVLAFFASGFFTVGPSEKAVILHFGKAPVGAKALLGPGLHWSFPYPIDEVVKIPISESQKIISSSGWYFTTPEQEASGEELPAGPSLNPAIDGYALTADHDIIHLKVTLSFRIEDPVRYVFDFVSASNSVQNALNNALLFCAARYNVDDILINRRAEFQDAVRQRVSEIVDAQRLGIAIGGSDGTGGCVVDSKPPRQLRDAFAQVTTARANRDALLNTASTYRDTTLLNASARAAAVTNEAATASANYVKYLKADARAFTDLLPSYQGNPSLFTQQRVADAMAQALNNVQDKIFLPQRADGKPRELRLQLSRELPPPKSASANP